jgi:ethanolamine utilization cobalamin adenosyltransferase
MALRGKLDMLEGLVLSAQLAASEAGAAGLCGELEEVMDLVRKMVSSEVMDRPLPPLHLMGMDSGELREASHKTWERYGVPFMYPSIRQGPVVVHLYQCRAYAREAELAAYRAFAPGPDGPGERADLKEALNRLSSAFYVMQCKYVGGHYGTGRAPGPITGWKPKT